MDFSEVYSDSVGGVSAAARSGSVLRVRTLIRDGLSLDVKDNRGRSCLHEGAARGHKGCVREILTAAAASSALDFRSFVNAQTHEGETPLFFAARYGHLSVAKLLLKAEADVNMQTNDLSCPLYAAVDGGHTQIVSLLLRHRAEVNRSHTASCWTCLHQAVYKGHSDIVALLSVCADLEAVDDYGITPLFLSAQYGQTTCLRILTARGANVNLRAADGATPLMIAAQEGHEECVGELLLRGANPNLYCSPDWPQMPIHAAAQFGHLGILRRLIPLTDPAIGHAPGQVSPVYQAVMFHQEGALQLLLREGFSPNAQQHRPLQLTSPLTQALDLAQSAPQSLDSVRTLLSAGATVLRETWTLALDTDRADFLRLILELRPVPGPKDSNRPGLDSHRPGPDSHRPGPGSVRDLAQEEVEDLLDECQNRAKTSSMWLPLVLQTGLEPLRLLQGPLLSEAPGSVVNLLLQNLNWSRLSPDLRLILDQRRSSGTWEPLPALESVPSLFHLCRLSIRDVLGSAAVMRTTILHRLPVPAPLHRLLQFRDVH